MFKLLITIVWLLSMFTCGGTHGLMLRWNPSHTPGVAYRVYRSTGTGSLQNIKMGLNTTSYLDQNIARGTSYTYTVRSVLQGIESSDSNKFSVKIP